MSFFDYLDVISDTHKIKLKNLLHYSSAAFQEMDEEKKTTKKINLECVCFLIILRKMLKDVVLNHPSTLPCLCMFMCDIRFSPLVNVHLFWLLYVRFAILSSRNKQREREQRKEMKINSIFQMRHEYGKGIFIFW